jgi:2-C-methyl-D-erythritol 4-phosphate cytidylyltransferase
LGSNSCPPPDPAAFASGNINETVGAVVVAAGGSSRMGGIDKIFSPLLGIPLLAHVLDIFEGFSPISQVALVLGEGSLDRGRDLVQERGYGKVAEVCAGGERRQDSVRNGLSALNALSPCQWVIIHDGARPCLDGAMLQRGLDAARESGAAVAGVPVKDTIKVVSSQGMVADTPPRDALWAAQTPQVFRFSLLWDAHQRRPGPVTDDAAMVESLGYPVKMFLGSYENLKVTTPEDLDIAGMLLRRRIGAGTIDP